MQGDATPRQEDNQPVMGYIVLARKPATRIVDGLLDSCQRQRYLDYLCARRPFEFQNRAICLVVYLGDGLDGGVR